MQAFAYREIKKIQGAVVGEPRPDDHGHHDPAAPEPSLESRGIRLGDVLFRGVAVARGRGDGVLLVLIAYKVVEQAWPAIEHFGLSFIWTEAWDPVKDDYGALTFIYGTVVTRSIALAARHAALDRDRAVPDRDRAEADRGADRDDGRAARGDPERRARALGHPRLRAVGRREPRAVAARRFRLHPVFSGDPYQAGMLPAALVLTIMIIPITSAICRELFSRTPRDLTDGALALGSTRWESIRGVMFAYAAPGHRRRRAARARPRVRRGDRGHPGDRRRDTINSSSFAPGDTLGGRIASQYQGATSTLQAGRSSTSARS